MGASLSGTDLGTLTGQASLPNMVANNSFSRQGGDPSITGVYQEDELKSHNHSVPYGAVSSSNEKNDRCSIDNNGSTYGTFASGLAGGSETRPKNYSFNFFIKVNKACNFN